MMLPARQSMPLQNRFWYSVHVRHHGIFRDSEPFGDVGVAHSFELVENQHFAGARRQCGQCGVQRPEFLVGNQHRIGQRRRVGDRFVEFDRRCQYIAATPAGLVDRQIVGGSKQIAAEVTDLFARRTQQA